MENRSFAMWTGLFVVLLSLAFGIIVWKFSGETKDQVEYLMVTKYSVAGLKDQAPVRYRGIDVGKVTDIKLDAANPLEILIFISLDKGTPITKGTFGTLGYQGVTGLAYVALEDRGDKPQKLEPLSGGNLKGAGRIPVKPSLIDILSDSGMAMIEKASDVMERLNQLLSEKNRASVTRTLSNFESASAHLEPAVKNAADVSAMLKKTLSDENVARINRLVANLEQASGDAKPLAHEVRQLVASLRQLSDRLDQVSASTSEEVNGVTLPRAHELMGELIRNSRSLNILLDEFERNPNAIIFGKPKPQAGPGEPGFEK